ncbi:hypothetical protein ACVCNR_14820 [Aquamicrobium terrae]
MIGRHLVPVHGHLRQDIAIVGKAEVGRRLQEDRPGIHPEPEFVLFMLVERELVRLLAVALEEACQRLPGIHDLKEAGIVDQFLGPVRRWRRGGDELEADALEQRQERLIGLRAVAAEDGRFIKRRRDELPGVDFAVAHALVIGDVDDVIVRDLVIAADEPKLDGEPATEPLFRLVEELVPDAERQYDQPTAADMLADQAHKLELD